MWMWIILGLVALGAGGYLGLNKSTEGLRQKIRAIEMTVTRIEVGLALAVIGFMVFLSFSQFILRNLVTATWAVNFTDFITHSLPFLIMVVGFMGASIGISKREVIQMDVLRRLYPESMRKVWNFFSYFMIMVVLAVFMAFAYRYANPIVDGLQAQASQARWVNYAFLPIMGMMIAKCFLVLVNPQIEQQLEEPEE